MWPHLCSRCTFAHLENSVVRFMMGGGTQLCWPVSPGAFRCGNRPQPWWQSVRVVWGRPAGPWFLWGGGCEGQCCAWSPLEAILTSSAGCPAPLTRSVCAGVRPKVALKDKSSSALSCAPLQGSLPPIQVTRAPHRHVPGLHRQDVHQKVHVNLLFLPGIFTTEKVKKRQEHLKIHLPWCPSRWVTPKQETVWGTWAWLRQCIDVLLWCLLKNNSWENKSRWVVFSSKCEILFKNFWGVKFL